MATARDKKISAKVFLNKETKPVIYRLSKDKELALYPLYVSVIYDKKSTRFRYYPEQWFDINEVPTNYFSSIEKDVSFILRHEIEQKKEAFKIQGFGEKVRFYNTLIVDFLVDDLELKMLSILSTELSQKEYKKHFRKLDFIEQLMEAHRFFGDDFYKKFANVLFGFMGFSFFYLTNEDKTAFDWIFRKQTIRKITDDIVLEILEKDEELKEKIGDIKDEDFPSGAEAFKHGIELGISHSDNYIKYFTDDEKENEVAKEMIDDYNEAISIIFSKVELIQDFDEKYNMIFENLPTHIENLLKTIYNRIV